MTAYNITILNITLKNATLSIVALNAVFCYAAWRLCWRHVCFIVMLSAQYGKAISIRISPSLSNRNQQQWRICEQHHRLCKHCFSHRYPVEHLVLMISLREEILQFLKYLFVLKFLIFYSPYFISCL